MNKLPIFKTVGQTFGFVVERRFFSLLRLIWLPAFLSVMLGAVPAFYQFSVYGFQPTPKIITAIQSDTFLNVWQYVNFIFSWILGAIIAISVHRMILLDDVQKGVYFYWRLTREEWLYIAAGIIYCVLALAVAALPWIAHFYYVATQELHVSLPLPDMKSPLWLLTLAQFFSGPRMYFVVFLSLFLALGPLARFGLVFPIIVAEGRLSFVRSWVLTRGNFWRLVGFWVVVVVLTYMLVLIMASILGVAVLGMFGGVLFGGKTVGALGIIVLAVPAAVSFLIYLVVGITIFIAAMSFSYKALAGPVAPTETFE